MNKLSLAISAFWGLICLPLSGHVYDSLNDSGILIRIFALLIVLAPVWLVYGWRWLTENRPMSAKFWLSIFGLTILSSLALESNRYFDEIALVPIYCLIPFFLLVWNFERGNMLWWRKDTQIKMTHLLPDLNYARGFHRLWVIASFLWVISISVDQSAPMAEWIGYHSALYQGAGSWSAMQSREKQSLKIKRSCELTRASVCRIENQAQSEEHSGNGTKNTMLNDLEADKDAFAAELREQHRNRLNALSRPDLDAEKEAHAAELRKQHRNNLTALSRPDLRNLQPSTYIEGCEGQLKFFNQLKKNAQALGVENYENITDSEACVRFYQFNVPSFSPLMFVMLLLLPPMAVRFTAMVIAWLLRGFRVGS